MTRVDARLLASFAGLDDQAFLGKAYIAILGRPVDPSGFRDYLNRLDSGVPRARICEELASSEEAKRHAARQSHSTPRDRPRHGIESVDDLLALEGTEFVEQVYWVLLGRAVDPDGLRHYTGRLAAGTQKLQVIADIHADPEGQAYGAQIAGLDELDNLQRDEDTSVGSLSSLLEVSDEAFVRAVYSLILGRQADPEGRVTYGNLLRAGFSRMYVIKEIACSSEGAGKALAVAGLSQALRRYEKANSRTWTGWYLRQVKGIESDLPLERHMRAASFATRRLT
jgi:hypothetical protein